MPVHDENAGLHMQDIKNSMGRRLRSAQWQNDCPSMHKAPSSKTVFGG